MSLNLTGSAPPPAFAAALQGAAGSIESSGRIELDRSTAKHLRPLGHEVVLWGKAIGVLQSRRLKNRMPADLAAFLDHWLPSTSPPHGPAEFALLLGQNESGFQLQGASMSFACDPLLWALLRLPALRDAWAADLRASHFEHLVHLLPYAWVVDPAPLVPGSEIAGLGLGSWRNLERLRDAGRSFELRKLGDEERDRPPLLLTCGSAGTEWSSAIEKALASRDCLLVDRPEFSQWWLARYGIRDGQVALVEAYEAAAAEAGWVVRKAVLD